MRVSFAIIRVKSRRDLRMQMAMELPASKLRDARSSSLCLGPPSNSNSTMEQRLEQE